MLPVSEVVHATIRLLGFCLGQTVASLWSRQTRDKGVSGRTLASLGIRFTGLERHTRFNKAAKWSHVQRQAGKQLLTAGLACFAVSSHQ